jgi:hypothetical protein
MGTGHNDFDPNAFGPFGPFMQTYISALEDFGRTFGIPSVLPSEFSTSSLSQRMSAPLKASARCQLELLGLANRRTQAYMQAPTRFAQCRTPQDVLNEQMAFWRTAGEQYAETSRKVFDAWAFADPLHYANGRPGGTERDYINFNGTGSKESGAQTTRSDQPAGKQRRVA